MTKRIPILLISVVVAGAISGCSSKNSGDDTEIRPRATVQVARAELGNINDMVNTTGSFTVLRDERVKSTVAGKVEKVVVLVGDVVKKGQVLATVLSQESYASITGALQLVGEATTPAEKQQAEEAVRLARQTAVIAKIRAPFSGAVTNRFVTEGQLVDQGANLVEIIDPKSEYFIAYVPVSYISSIRVGEPAFISIPGMNLPTLHGTVRTINPVVDPNSQDVKVRIDLASIPPVVSAGTFGNAQIKVGEQKSVVLVPKPAVYHNDDLGEYFVWRIQGDSIALLTQVDVGLSDSSSFEIISGLKPGDVVATVGGYGLPDSTAVTVTNK